MTLPLYAFVQGDACVLLVLASGNQTVATLANDIQSAAAVRIPVARSARVFLAGRQLAPDLTLEEAGVTPLARIDLVRGEDG